MKFLSILLILTFLLSCKKDQASEDLTSKDQEIIKDSVQIASKDTLSNFSKEQIGLDIDAEKTKFLKAKKLLQLQDNKKQLSTLVIAKEFFKEDDLYILDYKYPYLNEELEEAYASFNDLLTENYLNIEATENEILEDKFSYCDSAGISRCMDKRIIDYKIFSVDTRMISVLLYKENYYAGMKHSTYMFECLNYDLTDYSFKNFADFFVENTEGEVFEILNHIIRKQINSGDLYMDCWEISKGDFQAYKNNFVVDGDFIVYYFDDCVVCPSYTGTYAIEIPIEKVIHLIKKYDKKPLIG